MADTERAVRPPGSRGAPEESNADDDVASYVVTEYWT